LWSLSEAVRTTEQNKGNARKIQRLWNPVRLDQNLGKGVAWSLKENTKNTEILSGWCATWILKLL